MTGSRTVDEGISMDRRTLLRTAAAATVVPLAPGLVASAEAAPRVGRTLARGLSVPWGLAFLPNGDALVSERDSALVHRVSRRGGRRVVDEVPGVVPGGEGGLLGLELSPTFRRDRWVYAYFTAADDNRVVRMRYVDGRLGRPQLVTAGIPKSSIHNGGRLRFGPDRLLYVSTGDAAVRELAPRIRSKAGKILRMTPTGDRPRGNPYRNLVWSKGHRNVQGLAFDRRGRLWATEFGQNDRDELNRIVPGGDYGWPAVEGGDGPGPYRDPLVVWSPTATCSPSGLAIARGRAWVGALRGEALWSVRLFDPARGRKRRFLHQRLGRIRTVESAPDGTLWLTTGNGGDDRVVRVVLG